MRPHIAVLIVALSVAAPLAVRAAAAPACDGSRPTPGGHVIRHAGIERHYRLLLPPDYDGHRAVPLVLAFHGWGGDEGEFADDPHFAGEATRRGYALVAPRGLGGGPPDAANNSWTFRGSATGVVNGRVPEPICDARVTPDYTYASCRARVALNTCSWTQCQDDDVAFVADLLDELERDLCIDRSRIYATGGSNGGMFTWELGMDRRTAPRLRAIAPIIGLPHAGDLRPPGRPRGLPVLLVTGREDPVVPPGDWEAPGPTITSNDQDRFRYTGASAIVRVWSGADGCPVAGPARRLAQDAGPAECRSYCPASPARAPAVVDCRAPMGHDYGTAWTARLVFDFFDAH